MYSVLNFLSNIFTFQPPGALVIESFAKEVPPIIISAVLLLLISLAIVIITLYRSRSGLKRQLEKQCASIENYRRRLDKFESLANMDTAEREFETINRLVIALEHRDIETGGHNVRMAHYSRLIAKNVFQADSPMVGLIFLAAPMHDVGKIGISDKILGKPHRLNHFEYLEMQRHTLIGHDILKGSTSPVIRLGSVIALTHHEHYDGSGYPRGLKGDGIPMTGRIVAVADYFDALFPTASIKKPGLWNGPLKKYVMQRENASIPFVLKLFSLAWTLFSRLKASTAIMRKKVRYNGAHYGMQRAAWRRVKDRAIECLFMEPQGDL